MLFDLPLEQLQNYRPPRNNPRISTLSGPKPWPRPRRFPLEAHFEPVDSGLRLVETFDVTFNGYGGQPIKGWLILPRQRAKPLPCVMEYIGYGSGRGNPIDWLLWSNAGYAHFVMDTRGPGQHLAHRGYP